MINPKLTKSNYMKYRGMLAHAGIKSYVDQFGKTYTVCSECDKQSCKNRQTIPGCMSGEPKPIILKQITRGDK